MSLDNNIIIISQSATSSYDLLSIRKGFLIPDFVPMNRDAVGRICVIFFVHHHSNKRLLEQYLNHYFHLVSHLERRELLRQRQLYTLVKE